MVLATCLKAAGHTLGAMPAQPPSPKWCHLVWTTFHGRRWFKIADAAAFCERAVRAACIARGWGPDVILALPDRVHAVVRIPATVPRRAVSPPLQHHVTEALTAARLVQPGVRVWQGEGWCAVLASPAAVMVVRRHLAVQASRLGHAPAPSDRASSADPAAPRLPARARGIPARRPLKLEWLES